MYFWGRSCCGRKTHKQNPQKIPAQSRETFVFVYFSSWFVRSKGKDAKVSTTDHSPKIEFLGRMVFGHQTVEKRQKLVFPVFGLFLAVSSAVFRHFPRDHSGTLIRCFLGCAFGPSVAGTRDCKSGISRIWVRSCFLGCTRRGSYSAKGRVSAF